ncbi:unnamed protein product [Agarophyton chilense]
MATRSMTYAIVFWSRKRKRCLSNYITMGKFLKPGKIVILLQGRFAGKKAVIIQSQDNGTNKHSYGHCVVAGVEKYPRKVKKGMSKRKIALRSALTPFVKVANYNHIMPTRYTLDIEAVKGDVDIAAFSSPGANAERPEARKNSRAVIKKEFQQRYNAGKNRWFFSPLRF